jgi:endoplasmic reticulum lectin 1
VENYWNYQLCFGNYIRQFHEERDGKNGKLFEFGEG